MRKILFILLLIPHWAIAQTAGYPVAQSPYVNDFANIIDSETESRITQRLTKLRKTDGVELVVVTLDNIAAYGKETDVPAFTTALFNDWGVGDAEKNNGIMFLISKQDREVFIGLGRGYPPSYDDQMDMIFDQYIKYNFINENYNLGIEIGVDEIIKRTSDEWHVKNSSRNLGEMFYAAIPYIFAVVFAGFVAFGMLKNKIADSAVRLRKCPRCGRRSLQRNRETIQRPTKESTGLQTLHTTCRNCDFTRDEDRQLARLSNRSSSGRGGGFGGGSSSGGGGGGRW